MRDAHRRGLQLRGSGTGCVPVHIRGVGAFVMNQMDTGLFHISARRIDEKRRLIAQIERVNQHDEFRGTAIPNRAVKVVGPVKRRVFSAGCEQEISEILFDADRVIPVVGAGVAQVGPVGMRLPYRARQGRGTGGVGTGIRGAAQQLPIGEITVVVERPAEYFVIRGNFKSF